MCIYLNPFTLSRLFYNSLDESISNSRVSGCSYYYCFIKIPVLNAYSIDPDQEPHSAVSVGSGYVLLFPFTFLGVSRLVKYWDTSTPYCTCPKY